MDDTVGPLGSGPALVPNAAAPERSHVPADSSAPGPPRQLFTEFYDEHTPALVAFVRWLGADMYAAADIAQEAMLRAYQHWAEVKHPRTWLRTVASHEYGRRMAAAKDEPVAEFPDDLLQSDSAADEVALIGEDQAQILKVLSLLPHRQRQVMAWVYDGYAPKDIAKILGLTPGAVRVNLHHARATLKQHLTGEGGQPR